MPQLLAMHTAVPVEPEAVALTTAAGRAATAAVRQELLRLPAATEARAAVRQQAPAMAVTVAMAAYRMESVALGAQVSAALPEQRVLRKLPDSEKFTRVKHCKNSHV